MTSDLRSPGPPSYPHPTLQPRTSRGLRLALLSTFLLAIFAGSSVAQTTGLEKSNAGCSWDTGFFAPDLNGLVAASVVWDDGSGPALFVGGLFETAGGVVVNNIAKWDGTRWSALAGSSGIGTGSTVFALEVYDDGTGPALFVGGRFGQAGGMPARHIARWDGSEWSTLTGPRFDGTNQWVRALAAFDDGAGPELFVGGSFSSPGDHLAKWNGTRWAGAGSAVNTVSALEVWDDGTGPALYAGGSFFDIDGLQVNMMAMRRPGGGWSRLTGSSGFGAGLSVRVIEAFDDGTGPALYVGGFISLAGGIRVNNIARWDGTDWSAVGTGLDDLILSLEVYDDGGGAKLFAGGARFSGSPGAPTRLASWDGTSWSALSGPTGNGNVQALTTFDDGGGEKLFVGGFSLDLDDDLPVGGLATWDGSAWARVSGPGDGLSAQANALLEHDDGGGTALYAGGTFRGAGSVPALRVGAWDGVAWSALAGPAGNGADAEVFALAEFDDGGGTALYAAGSFVTAGGVAVDRIAKWDGSAWSALAGPSGFGADQTIRALAVHDDGGGPALFVAGDFATAGGVAGIGGIARWDGSTWSALSVPSGTGTDGAVHALAVYDDGGGPALYAGGDFATAGGVAVSRVAKWDRTGWSALTGPSGTGTDGNVLALAVHDDGSGSALYAGGEFSAAGGLGADRVARWDGVAWSALGTGTSGRVRTLTTFDDGSGPALLAGGDFTTAGGVTVDRLGRWDGSGWSAVAGSSGFGTDGAVRALLPTSDGSDAVLYLGGGFRTAGGVESARIARYVCPVTDLAVTKSDGVSAAIPGQTSLTYTIVAANLGSIADPAATLTDTLPPGLTCTYGSTAAGGATGNTASGSGNLSETLSLPAGSTVTYTVSCTIAPGVTGTLVNTATLAASIGDANPANNTATDADTVLVPQADLSVSKSDGVTSAVPGQTLTYTIVAANAGPSDDPSATLTDAFAGSLTCSYTSVASGGASGNTASGSGDLSEALSLPAGSSVTYTATCSIAASATGTLSNTATLTASVADGNLANNTATDADTVLAPLADLSVTKTDGVTSAVPGQTLTYTIVAANAGPSDEPSATLTDTFPGSLTCSTTSVASGGASGNTASGSGDLSQALSLPAGSSVTYTAICTIAVGATGTLSNTATVSASVADPNASNDSATDGDTVLAPEADLSVTKTDGVTSAVPGTTVTYTIVASNAGPSDEPSATLTDAFPGSLTCSYVSVASGGASGNTASGSGDLTETLALPVGSSVTYTATCTIAAGATGTLSNTATVMSSVTDPNASNDTATDLTSLGAEADLSVTKTDGVTSAVPGEMVTYTIVVANAGPSDEPSATLTDVVPGSLSCSYASVASGGASGNTSGNIGPGGLSETLSLPVGGSVTYTADCTIASGATGTLSNTATVAASAVDPNASNDTATDDDTVLVPQADLSVTKTDGVTSAVPGETVTYTIVASNAGPSDDPSATLTDVVPGSLACSYTSVASGGALGNTSGNIGPGAGDLSETLSLPAGGSVTYTADCTIATGATGTLSNTATVTASVVDPAASNDTSTDDDTVLVPQADLAVTKTDGVAAAVPGGSVTYTIVASNAGPSDEPSATLSDVLPGSLTCSYTSVASGGASGNTSGNIGSGVGDLGETLSLPAGSSVTYTADCAIAAGATGTLSNTATVSGSVADPDATNDSATDVTILGAVADLSITNSDGVAAAIPGDTLTYTIVASNAGPSVDPAATLTDAFPADLTCATTSVAAGGASGNTASGSGDLSETLSLPVGGSVTYTAVCTIAGGATGILRNTASIASSVGDPDPSNNVATDETGLGAVADLSISKTDGVTSAITGDTLTYTIVVANHGPSDDPMVRVTDVLADELRCDFASLAVGGAAGNTPFGTGDLVETLSLPAGSSVTYTLECEIAYSARGVLSNTATLEASILDTTPENDRATDGDTRLLPAAEIPTLGHLGASSFVLLLALLGVALVGRRAGSTP